MENVFDTLKAETFDVIATTMGYDAVWGDKVARVLFNEPSEEESIADHSYDYQRPTLEYKEGDWPGLRKRIEAKDPERIYVKGIYYNPLKILGNKSSARDGAVYKVSLQEDPDQTEED